MSVSYKAASVFEREPHWSELTVAELFAQQARLTPEMPAIVFRDIILTYQQLEARSNQLAHYLRQHDVGPEVVVALCLERGVDALEHLIGVLAVWKAGGAYLMLDPTYYPIEQIRRILAERRVGLILTKPRLRAQLPEEKGLPPVICLDVAQAAINTCPATAPINSATLDTLAYLIYTSGSTGQPKGVLTEQRWLPHLAHEQISLFQVRPGDRLSHLLAPSFDASLSEIVTAWLAGATLVAGPAEALRPGKRMVDFLNQYEITLAHFTPSVLAMLPEDTLPTLRTIVVGGKACPPELAMRHVRAGRVVIPVYGLTESTVCNFGYRYPGDGSLPSIGRLYSYTEVQIWNAQRQPVANGEEGQIVLAGPLARGYTNQALTVERFIEQDGKRWLLTGDSGKWLPDGTVRCFGRTDRQVKLPGEILLSLDEIEAVLCEHPQVADARAFLVNGRWLIAYVVVASPGILPMSELRQFLLPRLSKQAMPSCCVAVASLPLSENGKPSTSLKDYPELTVEDMAAYDGAFVGPQTPTEMELARLIIYFGTMEVEAAGVVVPVAGGLPFPTDPRKINVLKNVRELGLDSTRAGLFELGTRKKGRPLLQEDHVTWPLYKLAWVLDGGIPPMPEYAEGAR